MSSGRFRDQISIEREVHGDDGFGNVVTGWALWEITSGRPVRIWADVLERLGGERLTAGRLEAARLATVRVQSTTVSRQITAADRIVLRGARWKIISHPSQVGRRREVIELICEEWIEAPEVAS